MNKKRVSISLPQFRGAELKNATVYLEKGVVVVEYGQEDIEKDISEIALGFGSAAHYLLEDIHRFYLHTTKKHMPKLEAFSQLMILAEAWNAFDEFKPDWENQEQYKWHPVFGFKNGKIEFWDAGIVRLFLNPYISNFSFKTEARAEQFGRQFIDLFRIVLTN